MSKPFFFKEIIIIIYTYFIMSSVAVCTGSLTHLSLVSLKRDIAKQCRPRSGSTLFALNAGISIKHGDIRNNPTSLLLKMELSKQVR